MREYKVSFARVNTGEDVVLGVDDEAVLTGLVPGDKEGREVVFIFTERGTSDVEKARAAEYAEQLRLATAAAEYLGIEVNQLTADQFQQYKLSVERASEPQEEAVADAETAALQAAVDAAAEGKDAS